MSIAFLVTTLIVVATPGTGAIYALSAGLSHGRRASVVAALGCTLGIVPHMVAAITGMAALLHTSATAFQFVKYLGVAYLLYMAWAMLKDTDPIVAEAETAPRPAGRVIASGILLNLLNPKLTIFFFSFLPQFVDAAEPGHVLRTLQLGTVFMLVTLAVFAAYGVLAASVRDHVTTRPRLMAWLRRSFAGSFVALSAKLALAAR
ncbi:LysE family translocator [Actinomadura chokoriensis]|uniref:LysE family translocator n=1 Tax=Actinomadura chokoriensis TaxID=454156 RepID=A0ABV4QSD2_9ACTN